MKSIEERAKEYAPDQFMPDEVDDIFVAREMHFINLERNGYIAGATEEHELLTKWNSLDNPPDNDRQILIKVILTTDKEQNHPFYNIAMYIDGKYCYLYSESMKFDKIIGWREIHE